jgi:hypothetical protein
MIPNPGDKTGNPVNILLARAGPILPNFSSQLESPAFVPVSISFGQSVRGLKKPMSAKKSGGVGCSTGEEFINIMYMMMKSLGREERAQQEQSEREERANQAREDHIQQQEDRKLQQQFMNMMMTQMMGSGNKQGREESNNQEDELTPSKHLHKSSRKK